MKDLGNFLGRIGSGKSIHYVSKSEREDGMQFVSSACGADHATNNGTAGSRIIGELNIEKISCKKCLKRLNLVKEVK